MDAREKEALKNMTYLREIIFFAIYAVVPTAAALILAVVFFKGDAIMEALGRKRSGSKDGKKQ